MLSLHRNEQFRWFQLRYALFPSLPPGLRHLIWLTAVRYRPCQT